jgi:hypothetical protein
MTSQPFLQERRTSLKKKEEMEKGRFKDLSLHCLSYLNH